MAKPDCRTMLAFTESNVARYWSGIEKRGDTECWLWKGTVTPKGYGEFSGRRDGEKWKFRAHRVAYFLEYGVDPGSLWVLHKCDNPPCCNPKHLWLGNNTENNRDSSAKGRKKWKEDHLWRQHPDSVLRGERNGMAKLTEADVIEIRRLHATGMGQREIAPKFGTSWENIHRIVNRITWKHVG